MELGELIKRIKSNYDDIVAHKADYVDIPVEDVESILEYLEQLKEISEF